MHRLPVQAGNGEIVFRRRESRYGKRGFKTGKIGLPQLYSFAANSSARRITRSRLPLQILAISASL